MEKLWARMPFDLIGTISYGSLVLISILLNKDRGDHQILIKRRELAALMHCSERYINTLLHELETTGYILSRKQVQYGNIITLKPDILPPKKHSGTKHSPQKPAGSDASFDLSDWDALVNRF